MTATSEPGNIHDAFDDDEDNVGRRPAPAPAPVVDAEFIAKARQAHELEQSEAVLETLRLHPELTLMMTFTTLDGMSYVQIPDKAKLPVPVAVKTLRYLADLLEGNPVTAVCGTCARDMPEGVKVCPDCSPAALEVVVLDPLDDTQPPAPMEPCS